MCGPARIIARGEAQPFGTVHSYPEIGTLRRRSPQKLRQPGVAAGSPSSHLRRHVPGSAVTAFIKAGYANRGAGPCVRSRVR